jgi:hypothetical protein
MNEADEQKLRKRLLSYPNATEEIVNIEIEAHKERQKLKEDLINNRGFSNALAEVYLDRTGYPRPPGWHSVFFYPESNRLRNITVFWVIPK